MRQAAVPGSINACYLRLLLQDLSLAPEPKSEMGLWRNVFCEPLFLSSDPHCLTIYAH